MNKKIIYLKGVNEYNAILKKKNNKIPLIIKKIIFVYRNIFNVITKIQREEKEEWILPIKENSSFKNKCLLFIVRCNFSFVGCCI